MKIKRSTKCYFDNWLTQKKKNILKDIFEEYTRVVNWFIQEFEKEIPDKSKYQLLTKENLHKIDSWFSYRMKSCAFAEAYNYIFGAKKLSEKINKKYIRPVYKGNKLLLTSNIVNIFLRPDTKKFDLNVILRCIGSKIKLSIPLRKHKHFTELMKRGELCKSVFLTDKYIQFIFEIETGKKKEQGKLLGVDIGLKKMVATSDNREYGDRYYELLKKLKNKKRCSKAYYRCKEEIREYINYNLKKLPWNSLRLIVVEKLKNLKYKMKFKRRLNKNIRRIISVWNYRYILNRIQRLSEDNRVSFRSVPAYYTSITCSKCGHRDKRNRKNQEDFCCQSCGYSDNADFNASKNLLLGFLMGAYGLHFKVSPILVGGD